MDQILDRLWCGNFEEGQTVTLGNAQQGITQILNLSERSYPAFRVPVMHVPIPDECVLEPLVWEALTGWLGKALHGVAPTGSVLVHCRLGKSRAPSLCAAYLMRCGFAPSRAIAHVKQSRSFADPHTLTWQSVLDWYLTQKRWAE